MTRKSFELGRFFWESNKPAFAGREGSGVGTEEAVSCRLIRSDSWGHGRACGTVHCSGGNEEETGLVENGREREIKGDER